MRAMTALILMGALSAGAAQGQTDRPTPTPMPSVTLPPALDRVLRDYEKQWQARSATGLAQLFVEDGFVLQSGKLPVRGRAGIEQAYQTGGGPLSLRALAYATADTIGYIIGGYAGQAGSRDSGKFILLLRKNRSGTWQIVADMDNTNSRGGGPPPD